MVRAVLLFSGSGPSCLSVELLRNSETVDELVLLSFRSPFFESHERIKEIAGRNWPEVSFRSKSIKKDTEAIGKYGCNADGLETSNNCCISCRISMLRNGINFLDQVGGDFIVTGEVLGSKGIGRRELAEIDAEVGRGELVLRPLSADLLPDTLPERNGWFSEGRDLSAPVSGDLNVLFERYSLDGTDCIPATERCKLTRFQYRRRLKDLLEESDFHSNDLRLLDFNYYYKINPDTKIVLGVGSNEKHELHDYFLPRDLRLYLPCHAGPMALVRSRWETKSSGQVERIVDTAARIVVANSEINGDREIPVNYRFEHDEGTQRTTVTPSAQVELENFLI